VVPNKQLFFYVNEFFVTGLVMLLANASDAVSAKANNNLFL